MSIYSTVKTREQWMIRLYENVDKKRKKREMFFLRVEKKERKIATSLF